MFAYSVLESFPRMVYLAAATATHSAWVSTYVRVEPAARTYDGLLGRRDNAWWPNPDVPSGRYDAWVGR